MGQAGTIGLDIAKRVFQAHGADACGHGCSAGGCAAGHALCPREERSAAGERGRVPCPQAAGASGHAEHQRLARALVREWLCRSPGHRACRCRDRPHRSSELLRAGERPGDPGGGSRHLPNAEGADPNAGCRDHPAREGRPGRAPAHDDPRHRPDRRHGDHVMARRNEPETTRPTFFHRICDRATGGMLSRLLSSRPLRR